LNNAKNYNCLKNKLLNIIFFLSLTVSVFSQNYNIKHYTVEDGLLHSFVNDIIQDKRGNLWIATGGGLCKFNGVEFENFTTKDGLNFPRLLSLAEDDNDNIWIGSMEGLNIFNADSIYSLKNEKEKERIFALEKSANGFMWVATTLGVKKISFRNGEFISKKLDFNFDKIIDSNIFQERNRNTFLIETNKNQLFIGINNSTYIYQNKKLKKLTIDTSINVYSACKLSENSIVFGTNNGLYIYRDNKFKRIKNKNLNNFNVFKIKRKGNKLWMIGNWSKTNKNKLFLVSIDICDEEYFKKISVNNGLIDNPTSIFIDHENNIWIGSNGGLDVLKGESFVNYTNENGLIGNKIWGVFQDYDKKIWVGTIGNGLSIIAKDSIYNFDKSNGIPAMYISSIFQLDEKTFLLGTARNGLCKAIYNKETDKYTFTKLNVPFKEDDIRVDDIVMDKNNTIWIASSKGLFFSKDKKIFQHKSLFTNDSNQVRVNCLLVSDDEKILVGTKEYGLFEIKNENIKNEIKTNIISITKDYKNNIWIASQYKGIKNINDKNSQWITVKDGLKSDLIYILQSDKNSNLWIGTNLGLDKLNLKSYYKNKEVNFHHYNANDGLQTLEMNLNGSIEDDKGNLWFATNNGLLKYNAKYDISNRIPPITSITNIKLHSKNIDWSQYSDSLSAWNKLPYNLILPYNQNHLTFEFIGISYKNPKQIRYSWKLDGFDDKWVPSSSNRQVIYSNLPPGKYIFKLKSSNNDDIWNNKIIKFPFEISSPIWAKWWFISLVIIAILFLIYLYIRLRITSFKKRQIHLEKQVRYRTNEIMLQKEELQTQRDTVYNQKIKLEDIHLRLSDSIEYAKRIQDSILPDTSLLSKIFTEHFIIFKPKDLVSGDFYWWTNINNKTIITAVDCTGHGVPGAFMSMLGISFLREIVEKEKITNSSLILNALRENIIEALKQKGQSDEQKDGMDMSLIVIDHNTNMVEYSGANNPIFVFKKEKLDTESKLIKPCKTNSSSFNFYEIKPDKMPIAIYRKMRNFSTLKFRVEKGDQIYLFSDGYQDQFGGEKRKKFKKGPFKKLLIENANIPMREQMNKLNKTFNNWKGEIEQIDDVVVIGIKI